MPIFDVTLVGEGKSVTIVVGTQGNSIISATVGSEDAYAVAQGATSFANNILTPTSPFVDGYGMVLNLVPQLQAFSNSTDEIAHIYYSGLYVFETLQPIDSFNWSSGNAFILDSFTVTPHQIPACFGPATFITCRIDDEDVEVDIKRLIPGDLVVTKDGPREIIAIRSGKGRAQRCYSTSSAGQLFVTDTHAVAMEAQDAIENIKSSSELPPFGSRQGIEVIEASRDPRAHLAEDVEEVVYHVAVADEKEPIVLVRANGVWAETLYNTFAMKEPPARPELKRVA